MTHLPRMIHLFQPCQNIPLLKLRSLLKLNDKREEEIPIVIVQRSGDKAGLVVNKIIGQQEIIIKS